MVSTETIYSTVLRIMNSAVYILNAVVQAKTDVMLYANRKGNKSLHSALSYLLVLQFLSSLS